MEMAVANARALSGLARAMPEDAAGRMAWYGRRGLDYFRGRGKYKRLRSAIGQGIAAAGGAFGPEGAVLGALAGNYIGRGDYTTNSLIDNGEFAAANPQSIHYVS